jgi:hypothetical protein
VASMAFFCVVLAEEPCQLLRIDTPQPKTEPRNALACVRVPPQYHVFVLCFYSIFN